MEDNFILQTTPDDAILNGDDRPKSKTSAPEMARLEWHSGDNIFSGDNVWLGNNVWLGDNVWSDENVW
ncbi:acetyltransferase [Yersinia pestis subsp. microtus bv. Altaica]|uniref:Acetyltransferase (The isoleucine patch superfamily) n=1 Tax=Yersinia pseudotuberculosis serotype O:3 (strain YPIII) TaxID=502800 RepID=A0A0H3B7A8_YERPY|nr:Acetyltransferases (the isoleucine patchsuperfamily) [Yersinia pestis Pestoides A]KJG86061.1 acetyltransferase [Yersinia pestis subsp. microtus bv. Ulegeica]KPD48898.1 acetyltransferase [Yersinia pestis subsp. microtus bv. Caucasica]KPD59074.1 acetyltransferase [Yersinia pestis subsp. microtus bv. Hissarica]KPD61891.1 acetyltransferase [Yersinia pestis subsp. microtus bv. Talassica]KPD68922.1 acetyltransferase [Yersinia pestis subsp. microtus bv. Altaica]